MTCLNTPGLIDAGYRDELRVLLVNTDPSVAYEVKRGDRIAQLVIQAVEEAKFVGGRPRASSRTAPGGSVASGTPAGRHRRQGGGAVMERLSGLDASFLALETDTMQLHVSAVMVFEPSPSDPADDAGAAPSTASAHVVDERLHLVPPLRRRVVRVPFGLHHPVWVEDPDFDLDYHLRRASLPAPGGPNELAAFVAEVAGRPLDLDRPLWEMHVVEGLESGHFAVVPKLHHATIDGASGAEVAGRLPRPRSRCRASSRPRRGRGDRTDLPSERELVGGALSSLTRQPERTASASCGAPSGAVRDLAERNRRLREEDDVDPPPAPFRAPRTSLNGAISAHRRFAFLQVPLDDDPDRAAAPSAAP